ncbi:endonuclease MutS2 [Tepidibacter formicigenes]|jgi:DNA mismatch repair protein MutS2|uniref:Endonuclease MutS2 n=1 Tax=Tepidibacter formicigenes DSM 15518 TaxID=1123349 RepID=A0A1M6KRN8_9FIRM|nr:endonuclease MutS2 [Tepidibacter formicigenes]SHJ61564.1 DNA mismatch repair protein MutS2 [Tepidibacter formicigenes DSM 15518]
MKEKSLRVLEYFKIIEMLKEKVSSSLGARYVEKLTPSTDYEEVVQMQKETSEAQSIIIKRGSIPLGGIHDIEFLAKKTKIGSPLDAGQLLMVADTLRGGRLLKNSINNSEEESYPIIQSLASSLFTFKDIEDNIYNAIVSEVEISDNASPELRSIRRRIVQKNQSIRSKLNSIISSTTYQKFLQDAIITMRGDRFVVPVKQEYKSNVPGIVHDQSSSGATLFIEPMAIVNMNNELRELKLKEREEIEKILKELSEMIGEVADEIISNIEILGKLDFIFAKGKLSISMKAIEPNLNNEKYLNIKNGRHPLLDPQSVVPTNIWIGKDFNTLVITGPNTGGKTVTLKTVGLFCLMTQSGLHIPADFGTIMCVYDNVFSDIGDEQSIEQSLSTFSSHMTNIVDILSEVTENSLVLFDELGAGTDPVEGAALAMAILDDLYNLGALTIATTHYSELKHYALTKKGVENASVEFNIETLSPTYNLLIGVPGKSNAFEISKRLGLNDYIIGKAKEFINSENIEFEDLLQSIEKNRLKTIEEKEEAKRLKEEARKLKEEYEQKVEKVALRREKIVEEAKREASKILRNSKEEADRLIKEIRKLEKEGFSSEKNKKIENMRREISKSMGSLQGSVKNIIIPKVAKKQVKDLKPGDEVKVVSLNQQGSVLSVDNDKKEAQVQIGIMKMNLPFASLEKIKSSKKDVLKTGAGKILKKKARNIKQEIDLRGMNLEEAMVEVDKYLDDAYLSGIPKATIIHGIGTGVLKAGIKEMLKKHKHIKSYRDGIYGEGGAGVTIVEFK